MPIFLIFLTSVITGSKIRTMWMTPFYLFFGTFFVYFLKTQINIKKLKPFIFGFLFLFFISPATYSYISISKEDKRTDYPGKEIAIKTQYAWDQQFNSTINVVYGNEWNAGNLSYHLKSRPVWEGIIKRNKLDQLKDYMCLDNVCVGSK
jgi:energy-coupling factor transporter transmembrane protein EcfT